MALNINCCCLARPLATRILNMQYKRFFAFTQKDSTTSIYAISMLRNDRKWKYLFFFFLGPLLLSWFNLHPNMDNHMSCKVWDEITYPVPNFNGCTVEVWKWISNFISHFINGCNYLSMLLVEGAPAMNPAGQGLESSMGHKQCYKHGSPHRGCCHVFVNQLNGL